jgi:hypothetical protein
MNEGVAAGGPFGNRALHAATPGVAVMSAVISAVMVL